MKIRQISANMAALAVAGLVAGSLVLADENPAASAKSGSPMMMSAQPGTDLLSSHLINQKVFDQQGKPIGHITDLILDPVSGRISEAVVSYGGRFMGLGGKEVIVPWNSLKQQTPAAGATGPEFTLNETALTNAPEFKRADWEGKYARTLETFRGAIVSINQNATNGRSALQVRTDEGVMNVDLGSNWVEQKQLLTLKNGDEVQIQGYYAGFGGQRHIVAHELTANGQTVTLQTTGRPYRETSGEQSPPSPKSY